MNVEQLEKWFSDEHDRLIKEHEKTHGIIAKCLEGYMGGHDHAWIKFDAFLYDSGFTYDEINTMRRTKQIRLEEVKHSK